MSIHIGARKGEIAKTVLMPGDPYRAKWAAENFLDDAVCVNKVRGMLGYTGTWRGNPVSIQGSGMGMASLSIYANELIRDFGADTLIRIGSCGAMQDSVGIRDVILALAASSISTPSDSIFREVNFAPTPDFRLIHRAWHRATEMGITVHTGSIYSSDTFYDERPDLNAELTRHGCLAVEMETAELYTLAHRHGVRALSVLTVSDHLITGAALPSSEREQSFGDMIEIALQATFPESV